MARNYRKQPWLHCCSNCKYLDVDCYRNYTCEEPTTVKEETKQPRINLLAICSRFELKQENI
jgi:hypothetical protein